MARRVRVLLLAATMSLSVLPSPFLAAGVSADHVAGHVAPATVWDSRLASTARGPAYVWDGRLAGSSTPAYVWDGRLAGSSEPVYVWDGRLAGQLRSVTADKDDRADAYVRAEALRTDGHRLRRLQPDAPVTVALRATVRARKDLVRHRVALVPPLEAHLALVFPGAVGLFGG